MNTLYHKASECLYVSRDKVVYVYPHDESGHCYYMVSKEESIRCFLVLIEFEIAVLGYEANNLKLISRYNWYEINNVIYESNNYNCLTIGLSTVERFYEPKNPNSPYGIYILYMYILGIIFTKSSKSAQNLKIQEAIKQHVLKVSPILLKYFCTIPDYEIETEIRRLYYSMKKEIVTFDLSFFNNPENVLIPNILKFIGFMPGVSQVILPRNYHWDLIASFIRENKCVEHVTFNTAIDNDFPKVFSALTSTANNVIKSISFSNTVFDNESLYHINQLFLKHEFERVEFNGCFEAYNINSIVNECNSFYALRNITFKDINCFNQGNFIRFFLRASSIAFINCDIDISKLLPYIKDSQFTSLYIDGGFAASDCFSDEKLYFQSHLKKIAFRNIQWLDNSFWCCWRTLIIGPHLINNITIDLSYGKFLGNYCDNLFDSTREYHMQYNKRITHVIGLKLDGYPVTDKLIDMLPLFTKLNTLSLNESFYGINCTCLDKFGDYLSTNQVIQAVYMRGSSKSRMSYSRQLKTSFLDKLKNNKSIRKFDISDQSIGEENLIELSHVLKSTNIQECHYDGQNITKVEIFCTFFQNLYGRATPYINIEWPHRDVSNLRTFCNLSNTDINKLRLYYKQCVGYKPFLEFGELELPYNYNEPDLDNIINGNIWKINIPYESHKNTEDDSHDKYQIKNLFEKLVSGTEI